MSDVDRQWSFSNPGPETLLVWLESWADEFQVPAGSTITLCASGETNDGAPLGEVEWTADHLVVWANAAGTVKVLVDGELQESSSALVPVPEGVTKQMLNLVFAGQPIARLGGRRFEAMERTSWWRRTLRWFGL